MPNEQGPSYRHADGSPSSVPAMLPPIVVGGLVITQRHLSMLISFNFGGGVVVLNQDDLFSIHDLWTRQLIDVDGDDFYVTQKGREVIERGRQ